MLTENAVADSQGIWLTHLADVILASINDDLSTPCPHGSSPVVCVPCLNDAVTETTILAELEEGL